MANAGKTTAQLPPKTSIFDSNDAIVFIYGYDTANTANSVAQTAIISAANLFGQAGVPVFPTAVQTVNFSLNTAQISTLYSNATLLVAAPGANNVIVPLHATAWSSNGTAWTNPGGICLSYIAQQNQQLDNAVIQGAIQTGGIYSGRCVLAQSFTNSVNLPVYITCSVNNPSAGNTTISGFFQYFVLGNMP